MTYFGILVSPCQVRIEIPDCRVMVVEDRQLGTNDCRGWIARSVFNRLKLPDHRFYQFRLAFEKTQAKGSFKRVAQSLRPSNSAVRELAKMKKPQSFWDAKLCATRSRKCWSRLSLKVLTKCGLRLCCFQMRCTAMRLIPCAPAMLRTDQWVALEGLECRGASTTVWIGEAKGLGFGPARERPFPDPAIEAPENAPATITRWAGKYPGRG